MYPFTPNNQYIYDYKSHTHTTLTHTWNSSTSLKDVFKEKEGVEGSSNL